MLELKNVSAGYEQKNIIRDLSLCFETGKIYAVVGRNGCGKSTLMKTCAGLLVPSEGSILLEKRELHAYAPVERAKLVSYLSQTRNVPSLRVERLVEHGRYPRLSSPRKLNDGDHAAVACALERMRLTHLRSKNLNKLSGGERQRAYLAMLLAQDAPLLLMDEPATYMDVEYQMELLELLGQLKREGKCIVMVMHDLTGALRYSDCIIVMDDGCIVQAAPPEEILASETLERIFHVHPEAIGKPVRGYLLNKI